VREPKSTIGLKCFEHANAVEMHDALKKLQSLLSGRTEPVAINMSMGTHVGPHNGKSPLEDFVGQFTSLASGRIFHASVGNDGFMGVSGRREITAGVPEFLKVRTGSNNCSEILIKFWWEDQLNSSVSFKVAAAAGKKQLMSSFQIDSTSAAATLISGQAFTPPGFGQVTCHSLFHAKCHNNMSCIAFAVSTGPAGLAVLDLEFTLRFSGKYRTLPPVH